MGLLLFFKSTENFAGNGTKFSVGEDESEFILTHKIDLTLPFSLAIMKARKKEKGRERRETE